MIRLVRKLHNYAGLQSLVALILFGLTGLCATYVHSAHFTPPEESLLQLSVAGKTELSDRELVDAVFDELNIPLAPRPPDWSIKTGPSGEVRFDVRTPQSLTRVEIVAGWLVLIAVLVTML